MQDADLILAMALAAAPSHAGDNIRGGPLRTAKERFGGKASDEQHVDNCKVPPDLRGPKPGPERGGGVPGARPNFSHRDYSPLSCDVGDTQFGPSAKISAGCPRPLVVEAHHRIGKNCRDRRCDLRRSAQKVRQTVPREPCRSLRKRLPVDRLRTALPTQGASRRARP
jgi:hypothetical protein